MVAASIDTIEGPGGGSLLAKLPENGDVNVNVNDDDDDVDDEDDNTVQKKKATKPRPKRTSKRPAAKEEKKKKQDNEEEEEEEESTTKSKSKLLVAHKKKAPRQAAKNESSKGMDAESVSVASSTDELGRTRFGEIVNPPKDGERNILSDSSDDDDVKEEDKPLVVELKKKKKKSTSSTNKPKATKKKADSDTTDNDRVVREKLLLAQESDSDDEKDRPFRIEYSVTGRATCKTCDERIAKGELRVGHRPLFRGKPGFVIYRHLSCALFSETITQIAHVGGSRRLTSEDQQALEERIETSRVLLEKEDQEVHADELVQVAFQGEMRTKPPGLAATLLPFQQEGVSWMYHQERQVPEIRGGILADEMGMVSKKRQDGMVKTLFCGQSMHTSFNTIAFYVCLYVCLYVCIYVYMYASYRERPFKPLRPFWTTAPNFNTVNLE
jgi:hypothetical protein